MSDIVVVNNFSSIPKEFYPEGKNEPFCKCVMCNRELLDGSINYVIEKSFKQDVLNQSKELIFEFVYCVDCVVKFREELSKDSIEKIDKYFAKNVNFDQRQQELEKHKLFDPEIWLNNCVVKNKSIDEVDEYQIFALCTADNMLFYNYPYMVCGEAMDEMQKLLSKHTLDKLDDFWADHVDLPPELEEIFRTKRPVLL